MSILKNSLFLRPFRLYLKIHRFCVAQLYWMISDYILAIMKKKSVPFSHVMFVCLKMTAYAYAMPSDVLKKTTSWWPFFLYMLKSVHMQNVDTQIEVITQI